MVGEVLTLGAPMEGYESSSSYVTTSLSTTLSAVGGERFILDELGFYVHTAGSYDLWLDDVLVASFTAPTRNAMYRFTGIATPLQSQTIALVPIQHTRYLPSHHPCRDEPRAWDHGWPMVGLSTGDNFGGHDLRDRGHEDQGGRARVGTARPAGPRR